MVTEARRKCGDATVYALGTDAAMRSIAFHAPNAATADRLTEKVCVPGLGAEHSYLGPGLPYEGVLNLEVALKQQAEQSC